MQVLTPSDRELSRILEALANETRLQVVRMIAQAGSLYCRELISQFPLSQPTMSHHVGMLVRSGILHEHRDGLRCYYTVDRDLLKRFGLHIVD